MIWLWAGFIAFVLVMLVIDLFLINKGDEVVPVKKALAFTAFTVFLAGGFAVLVYFMYTSGWLGMGRLADGVTWDVPKGSDPARFHPGLHAASDFVQAWLLEYSLSVDNLFVFAIVFRHFRVAPEHQHRVLFWGIIGALAMRAGMILVGAAAIKAFEPILYVFGVFLIFTAIKLLRSGESEFDPEKSWLLRIARRVLPITHKYEGNRFTTRLETGARVFTPLFLVLLVVEGTDVVFAVDSIPAAFGITHDTFIIFTSNVFAILGLRSLYFALAHLMDRFRFLKISLAAVLAFVGVKMMIELPIPAWGYEGIHVAGPVSLGFIVVTLALGVAMSWVIPPKHPHPPLEPPPQPPAA